MSKSDRVKRQSNRRREGGGNRPDTRNRAARMREAEEVLATVRLLWRNLLRNPHADAEAFGMTGPQVVKIA